MVVCWPQLAAKSQFSGMLQQVKNYAALSDTKTTSMLWPFRLIIGSCLQGAGRLPVQIYPRHLDRASRARILIPKSPHRQTRNLPLMIFHYAYGTQRQAKRSSVSYKKSL